jgi:hypothetical protein
MRVHEDIMFSDHFPLTFEMEFEDWYFIEENNLCKNFKKS